MTCHAYSTLVMAISPRPVSSNHMYVPGTYLVPTDGANAGINCLTRTR